MEKMEVELGKRVIFTYGSAEELVSDIQDTLRALEDEFPNQTRNRVTVEYDWDCESSFLTLIVYGLESDEAYKERIARQEAYERQQYKQLKKNYEKLKQKYG